MFPLLAKIDSLLIPFILLVLWILSSLAGMLAKRKQQQPRPRPVTFQPPPTAPQSPNRPPLRRVLKPAITQPASPPPRPKIVASPKPSPAIPPQPLPVSTPAPRLRLRQADLRTQIVISELLQPPLALRDPTDFAR